MPTDIFSFVGHEHGGTLQRGATNGTTAAAQMTGAPVTGQFSRRGYQWRYDDASGVSQPAYTQQFGVASAQNVGVGRDYFAVPAFPTSRNQAWLAVMGTTGSTSPYWVVRLRTDGYLEAGFGVLGTSSPQAATLTGSVLSTTQVCPGRWNRVDYKVDGTTNPWKADWYLNGEPQPQSTNPQAARTWAIRHVGNPAVHTNPATTLYIDDSAVGTTGFPFGPGESYLLKVDSFDFDFVDNTMFRLSGPFGVALFRFENGTLIEDGSTTSGLTTPEADVWRRVADDAPPLEDNVAIASANDGLSLEMFAPFGDGATTTYGHQIVLPLETVTLKPGQQVACMVGWREKYMSSPQPGRSDDLAVYTTELIPDGLGGTIRTVDEKLISDKRPGATDGTVDGQAMNDGTNTFMERFATPTGGWDQAKLDELVALWRYDASGTAASVGYHGLAWLAVEVHLTATDEFEAIGCPQEKWGSI